jgi:hypothetical protein
MLPAQNRKLSEIMKEMSELLLRDPAATPSSEAAHVALFFANAAWNECVGLDHPREGYRSAWETIEAENPALWNEFKSNHIDGMIDELVKYKKAHYPDDLRRILTCGIPDGNIRVEWLPAAAPGVDVKWETRLYGLVRIGEKEAAICFLRETRGLSRAKAAKQVARVADELGVGSLLSEFETARQPKKRSRKPKAAKAMVFQLKITLNGAKPPIWRRVQTKDCTLARLHDVIQLAMGWQFCHLHTFEIGGESYSTHPEMECIPATRVKLSQLAEEGVDKFAYVYDMGDNWEHGITIEKTLPAEAGVRYPRCIAGKRACPPEDCGGTWGYEDFLAAIRDQHHEEHQDMLEWVGGDFDPERFDLQKVNGALKKVRR